MMSNQEILEKAIQKAIDGGWRYSEEYDIGWADVDAVLNHYHFDLDHEHYDEDNYLYFIFNHDFAKGLWGEHSSQGFKLENGKFEPFGNEGWQSHLRKMVIADDPIKYLGENL